MTGRAELTEEFQRQRDVLKGVATTLKGADCAFALAGGYAIWARGGPESTHDVDFVLPSEQVDQAVWALLGNGFQRVSSPEDWLVKVEPAGSGTVVDLIHRLPMGPIDADLLARCDPVAVDSVTMPVMSATDLLLSRMLALGEHSCDLSPIIAASRALREQIDWPALSKEADASPFARAALVLLRELEVVRDG